LQPYIYCGAAYRSQNSLGNFLTSQQWLLMLHVLFATYFGGLHQTMQAKETALVAA
jgi:hypothetical protein